MLLCILASKGPRAALWERTLGGPLKGLMHQACGTSQMAPEEVGCVQVMFSHSEHPDSCRRELRTFYSPVCHTLLAWVPPESQLQRDRCGARRDPLSVEQLIDDQPEFGAAALWSCLHFAT